MEIVGGSNSMVGNGVATWEVRAEISSKRKKVAVAVAISLEKVVNNFSKINS